MLKKEDFMKWEIERSVVLTVMNFAEASRVKISEMTERQRHLVFALAMGIVVRNIAISDQLAVEGEELEKLCQSYDDVVYKAMIEQAKKKQEKKGGNAKEFTIVRGGRDER